MDRLLAAECRRLGLMFIWRTREQFAVPLTRRITVPGVAANDAATCGGPEAA